MKQGHYFKQWKRRCARACACVRTFVRVCLCLCERTCVRVRAGGRACACATLYGTPACVRVHGALRARKWSPFALGVAMAASDSTALPRLGCPGGAGLAFSGKGCRYLVLRDNVIYYYKADSDAEPKGSIFLDGCRRARART
jgi:hypothetical protein